MFGGYVVLIRLAWQFVLGYCVCVVFVLIVGYGGVLGCLLMVLLLINSVVLIWMGIGLFVG